jgi:hypothetical protein
MSGSSSIRDNTVILVLTIHAILIAILAWVAPFQPVRPSPFTPGETGAVQEVPLPTSTPPPVTKTPEEGDETDLSPTNIPDDETRTPVSPQPGNATAVAVRDNTDSFQLEVPASWQVYPRDRELLASEDLEGWRTGFGGTGSGSARTPGIFVQVREQEMVDIAVLQEFIDQTSVPDNCEFSERLDYSDVYYEGFLDSMPCDKGEYVAVVAFDPDNPTFIIWIEAYVISQQDAISFAHAMQTFYVLPGER